jgi:hypothetical protein
MLIGAYRLVVVCGVGALICFGLMALTRARFERSFASEFKGLTEYAWGFLIFYFTLPLLFAVTGTTIIAAPNPAVQNAVSLGLKIPKELEDRLVWFSALQAGGVGLALLGVSISRLRARATKDSGAPETVFLLFVAAAAVLALTDYLAPGYIEFIFEAVLKADFLTPYSAAALTVLLVTEAAAGHLARSKT